MSEPQRPWASGEPSNHDSRAAVAAVVLAVALIVFLIVQLV